MILRSLNDLYYRLLERGEIAPEGWKVEVVTGIGTEQKIGPPQKILRSSAVSLS
jgi:hypothetical protein